MRCEVVRTEGVAPENRATPSWPAPGNLRPRPVRRLGQALAKPAPGGAGSASKRPRPGLADGKGAGLSTPGSKQVRLATLRVRRLSWTEHPRRVKPGDPPEAGGAVKARGAHGPPSQGAAVERRERPGPRHGPVTPGALGDGPDRESGQGEAIRTRPSRSGPRLSCQRKEREPGAPPPRRERGVTIESIKDAELSARTSPGAGAGWGERFRSRSEIQIPRHSPHPPALAPARGMDSLARLESRAARGVGMVRFSASSSRSS